MHVKPCNISGVKLITPKLFGDDRGFFYESFQTKRYHDQVIATPFVQDNISRSAQHVLRGLHHQQENTQDKLIWVLQGSVFDVVLDIRKDSPTFGQWESFELSSDKLEQLFIPKGCAHGFCVTSEAADFIYKVTDFYHPQSEISIAWNDPDLNIPWPTKTPVLSDKDKCGILLKDFENLSLYEEQEK